jgi:predicted nucleic acid-binding protein
LKSYFDTSFLVSAYIRDVHSRRVAAVLQSLKSPIPITALAKHELRNAVRLCAFRSEIAADTCREVLTDIDDDLRSGVLQEAPLVWADLWAEAEALSEKFTVKLGVRAADIMHVAAARVLGVSAFYTFDARQSRLAGEAGLTVLPRVR